MTSKRMIVIAGIVFALAVNGGALAYVEIAKPSWWPGAKPKPTATPVATATPSPTLGASITPMPVDSGAQALAERDNERRAALAAYAAGYKATAKNGYYSVNPPAVTVTALDPTTQNPSVIAKTAPTAVGQIRYWPGGSCSGPGITPGAGGTKYLALQTMLEGTATPYCLDVK